LGPVNSSLLFRSAFSKPTRAVPTIFLASFQPIVRCDQCSTPISNIEETILVLYGSSGRFENFHAVYYSNMISRSCLLQMANGSFSFLCYFEAKAVSSSFDNGKLFVNLFMLCIFSGRRCWIKAHTSPRRGQAVCRADIECSYACTQIAVFLRDSGLDWSVGASPLLKVES